MQADSIDLGLPRRPAAAPPASCPWSGAAPSEPQNGRPTARIAEALRSQLRDLQAQQRAITRLLEELED